MFEFHSDGYIIDFYNCKTQNNAIWMDFSVRLNYWTCHKSTIKQNDGWNDTLTQY